VTLAEALTAWANRRQKRWEIRNLMKAQRIAAGLTLAQRLKGPTERQGVTIGMFALTVAMLLMVREDPKLWDVKLFEVVFQAVVLTGLLNMILAFHFAANKGDETKSENTGKLADAFKSVAENSTQAPTTGAAEAADTVAEAAVDAAAEITEAQI
jgi:hypothetical protein